MKKIMKSAIALLLCFVMLLGVTPVQELIAWAATIGDRVAGDTGLDTNINTNDFISLPIEIYDFKADGMLFQYSERRTSNTKYTWQPADTTYGFDFRTDTLDTTSTGWFNDGYKLNRGWNVAKYYDYDSKKDTRYLRATRNSYGTSLYDNQVLSFGPFDTAAKNTQVKYMAICYRASSSCDDTAAVLFRGNSNTEPWTVTTWNFLDDGVWHTAVVNLENSSYSTAWNKFSSAGSIKYIGLRPADSATGATFDVAYVAFFSDETSAKNYNTKAFKSWQVGNNGAFGLVGSSYDYDGTNSFRRISLSYGSANHNTGSWFSENSYTVQGTKYVNYSKYKSSIWQIASGRTNVPTDGIENYLGYKLIAEYGSTAVTAGLLDPALDPVSGLPTYKEETVYYIANLLKTTLAKAQKTSGGLYKSDYVMGESYDYDGDGSKEQLAAVLRTMLNGKAIGNWNTTYAKRDQLIGAWSTCKDHIETYMDAAYYLLNNIFVKNSYNIYDDTYHHLLLSKTKVDGVDCFVFDGGFATSQTATAPAIKYDETAGTIQNTSAAAKPYSYYSSSEVTTSFPFLPLTKTNNSTGMTKCPYPMEDGNGHSASNFDTYQNRNYNYMLRSHGEFVYQESENLFFEFEGDDDVYLFINGQLVLDIGGAHPVATQKINLNAYVKDAKQKVASGNYTERDKALAMIDGESYSFDFFYLERHGYGANMRIVTNIRVMDTNIDTTKSAYQNGAEIPDGGVVNVGERVEFGFKLTNSGDLTDDVEMNGRLYASLYDLTFTDPNLNLQIGPSGINFTYNGSRKATDANGNDLDYSDLIFYHIAANGDMHPHTFASLEELTTYLTNPENGAGLRPGESILIRGIYTKLTDANFNSTTKLYTNTIIASANSGAGTYLRDEDPITLRNLPPIKYYMWADRDISVSRTDLLTDINNAIAAGAITGVSSISSIQSAFVSMANGIPVDDDYITWEGVKDDNSESGILRMSFDTTGSYMRYLTVVYTSGSTTARVTVPIQIFVMDVKNQVFVLDYGLSVELSANGALQVGDTVSVPGRPTEWFYEGITAVAPSYRPGPTNNHLTLNPDALDGTYYFVMSSTQNPNWTVTAPSMGNLKAEQVTTQGDDNLFSVRSAGDGYYTIQSKQTGMYLTLGDVTENEHGQVRNYVTQAPYIGADNQLWKITEDAGSYHIAAKSTRAKEGLQYLYCNGSTTVMAIGNSATSTLNYQEAQFHWNMVKMYQNDYAGNWTLTPFNNSQFALAVTNSSMESGAGISLWEKDGSTSFDFVFHVAALTTDSIYYTIKSNVNDLYLTDLSSDEGNNEVALQKYTGANNQLWKVTPGTDGAVRIQSRNSSGTNTVLGVVNNEYKNGGTVQESSSGGQWILTPAKNNGSEFHFDKENSKLTYTPGDFMEYAETIYILVRVHEVGFTASNIGTTDINNEVEMYKAVTVIPASVIYYEDDFPAIHYSTQNKNTITTDGTSSDGLWQSNDQSEQYGHDHAYEGESDVTASGNGSYHKVTITSPTDMTDPAAWFEFTGTGFELISRTNAHDSASLFVRIMQGEKLVRLIPVITEFDHDANGAEGHDEEIYQVPVIKVEDLPYGKYTVQIIGVAAYDYSKPSGSSYEIIPTVLYIDGIRIFNPVGGGNMVGLENTYSATEQGVTFTELRDLIYNGHALAAEWYGDGSWTFGSSLFTYTENRIGEAMTGEIIGNTVTSIDDYVLVGPNNEIYMDSSSNYVGIGFYVKSDDTPEDNTLQIGVRVLDDMMFYLGEPGAPMAGLSVGTKQGDVYGWYSLVEALTSGTEQYYVIDYTACPKVTIDGEEYYQVVISVDWGMVSFTSLKYKGLTIKENEYAGAKVRYSAEGSALEIYDEETDTWKRAAKMGNIPNFFTLGNQFLSTARFEPEVPGNDYVPPCEAERPNDPEGNPNTGDDGMILFVSGLLMASLLSIAVILLTNRKKTV